MHSMSVTQNHQNLSLQHDAAAVAMYPEIGPETKTHLSFPAAAAKKVIDALYPNVRHMSEADQLEIAKLSRLIEKSIIYPAPENSAPELVAGLTKHLQGMRPTVAREIVLRQVQTSDAQAWRSFIGGVMAGSGGDIGGTALSIGGKVVETAQKFYGMRSSSDESMAASVQHAKKRTMELLGISDDALYRDAKGIGEFGTALLGALHLGKGVMTLARHGEIVLTIRTKGAIKHALGKGDIERLEIVIQGLLSQPGGSARLSAPLRSELVEGLCSIASSERAAAPRAGALLRKLERNETFADEVKLVREARANRRMQRSPDTNPNVDRRLRGQIDVSDPREQLEVTEKLRVFLPHIGSLDQIQNEAKNLRISAIRNNGATGFQHMTDVEIYLLNKYSGMFYNPVNAAARQDFAWNGILFGGLSVVPPDSGQFARLLVQSRAILSRALSKLPDVHVTLYRGVTLPANELAKLRPGSSISLPGLSSSSSSAGNAFGGNCFFIIDARHAKDIKAIADIKSEEEMLLAHDMPFKVISTRQNGGELEVHLRELDPPKFGH